MRVLLLVTSIVVVEGLAPMPVIAEGIPTSVPTIGGLATSPSYEKSSPFRIGGFYKHENLTIVQKLLHKFTGYKPRHTMDEPSPAPAIFKLTLGINDIAITRAPLTEIERLTVEWKLGDSNALDHYVIGQYQLAPVVWQGSDKSSLTIPDILLAIKKNYEHMNNNKKSSPPSNIWVEKSPWSALMFKERVYHSKYLKASMGMSYTMFESIKYAEREKVLSFVRSHHDALGFISTKPQGVDDCKVLSLKTDDGLMSPSRSISLQTSYPFREMIVFHMCPDVCAAAREFSEFCVAKAGAQIVSTFGMVTPWHEKQYYADRRVKAMKAGKGAHIRMVGDALYAAAAQDLAVAYVRAKKPIQFRYVPRDPGIDADYVRRFVTAAKRKQDYRMPLFLCRGPLAPGGEHDLPGLKQYRLAADAPVVVVNAANDIPSLTPDAVAKIFTGRVTQWGAVSASTGRIAACALKTDPAAGRYVRRRSGGRMPPAIHRCGDRRALCGRIAADVQAIGLLGAAHLAGGRDRLPGGVRVVPIAGRAGPVMPRGKTILSGAYPLSAGMYVCVAGDVGEAAADLVAFLRSEDAQAAFAACGMITAATRMCVPGDGDAAAPGIPAGDDADQGQSDAAQDTKREEHTIPESTEGDGVGGLPFD